MIYNIVGGTNYIAHGANPYIYAKLNWNQPEVPGTLGYVSLVLLALLALHFLLYLVNSLFRRNWRFTELCWSCWAGRDTGKVRGEESSSDGARLTVPLTQDYENEKI